MVNNSPAHSELAVFEGSYALLCNTITDIIDPLMKCCVEEKNFTAEEEKEIMVIPEALEKLRLLLLKISNSLKADDTRGFYIMLKVMKQHGSKGTQTLAYHMMSRLKNSCDKLSHISSGDVSVEDNKSKG